MPRILSGKMILLMAALALLDYCLLPALQWGSARPVLLYLTVLYVAFRWPREKIVPAAIAVGLLRDMLGSGPLGVEFAALVFSAFLLDLAVQKMDHNSGMVKLAMTFLFVQLIFILQAVLAGLLGTSNAMAWHVWSSSFATAFLTTLAGMLFYPAAGRIFRDDARLLKQYELFS